MNFFRLSYFNQHEAITWTQREVMNMINYTIEKLSKLKSIQIINPGEMMELLSTTHMKMSCVSNLYLKDFESCTFEPPTSDCPILEQRQSYFREILIRLHFFKSCLGLITTFGRVQHFHSTFSEIVKMIERYVQLTK